MISKALKAIVLGSLILFASCEEAQKEEVITMSDNVLVREWTGPYEGVPAFDKLSVESIKEAVEEGMVLNLKEIKAIANNSEAPNFENTII